MHSFKTTLCPCGLNSTKFSDLFLFWIGTSYIFFNFTLNCKSYYLYMFFPFLLQSVGHNSYLLSLLIFYWFMVYFWNFLCSSLLVTLWFDLYYMENTFLTWKLSNKEWYTILMAVVVVIMAFCSGRYKIEQQRVLYAIFSFQSLLIRILFIKAIATWGRRTNKNEQS